MLSERGEGAHVGPPAVAIDVGAQPVQEGAGTTPHIVASRALVQIGLCGACGLVLDLVQGEIDNTIAAGGPVGIPLRTEVELRHGRVALQSSSSSAVADPTSTSTMPETVSGLDAFWDELQVQRS